MTGSPLRRLQELAVVLHEGWPCSRATKQANLAALPVRVLSKTAL